MTWILWLDWTLPLPFVCMQVELSCLAVGIIGSSIPWFLQYGQVWKWFFEAAKASSLRAVLAELSQPSVTPAVPFPGSGLCPYTVSPGSASANLLPSQHQEAFYPVCIEAFRVFWQLSISTACSVVKQMFAHKPQPRRIPVASREWWIGTPMLGHWWVWTPVLWQWPSSPHRKQNGYLSLNPTGLVWPHLRVPWEKKRHKESFSLHIYVDVTLFSEEKTKAFIFHTTFNLIFNVIKILKPKW